MILAYRTLLVMCWLTSERRTLKAKQNPSPEMIKEQKEMVFKGKLLMELAPHSFTRKGKRWHQITI